MQFRFDDLAWTRASRARVLRLENKAPLLKSIGEEMMPRINQRFKQERGPDGKGWARLQPRTIEARLKRYGNAPLTVLRMRGHLAGSINYQVKGAALSIGTGSEVSDYAAIHQFGGKAGRNHKVQITARPYLGFGDDDMQIIEEEAEAFLMGT
jgi:phage virion morphogenesis protein